MRIPWLRRPRRLRDLPVRTRVAVAASTVAAIGATIGAAVFVVSLQHTLRQELVVSTVQQASSIVTQLERGTTAQEAVVSSVDDMTIQVIEPSGTLVGNNRTLDRPLRTTPGFAEGVQVRPLRDQLVVAAKRASGGELVVVGRSEEHVTDAVATAVGLLAVAVPAGVLLLALVIWFSLARALRPVEAMRRQAESITSEHLDRRLPVPVATDEIGLLSTTLNEMLDRIDSAHTLQRQFVSDASHELRSPLAAIKQMVEVVTRYPDSLTALELAQDIGAEEERMEGLVTALLTLARLDHGSAAQDRSVTEIDEIVLTEVARARATGAGRRIVTSRLDAAPVRGSAVLLTQLVRNLISNAVRHAHDQVGVTVVADESEVVLVVEDDGDGIPEGERTHVFERFVRLDEARHRDSGGNGLGLAIVAKVTDVMHGSVLVDSSPLGGARLAVRIPVVDQTSAEGRTPTARIRPGADVTGHVDS